MAEGEVAITNRDKVITSFIAGALAGSLAKTTIAPLDRTKINFQIHNEQFSFTKAIQFLVKSYKEHGLLSWWRGNTATMARVVPFAACQYAAHEHWKIILKVDTNERRKKHYFRTFLAGSLAGCTASTLTYPLDVARARMAVSMPDRYRNIIEVFREIWRLEGPRNLYRGFAPTMLGVIPYAGASFFTYETLKRLRADGVHRIAPGRALGVWCRGWPVRPVEFLSAGHCEEADADSTPHWTELHQCVGNPHHGIQERRPHRRPLQRTEHELDQRTHRRWYQLHDVRHQLTRNAKSAGLAVLDPLAKYPSQFIRGI
nr:mitochondrial coenzyme A transporter SLC25A42-like isoform X3 [Rhipicephalus microplus]